MGAEDRAQRERGDEGGFTWTTCMCVWHVTLAKSF